MELEVLGKVRPGPAVSRSGKSLLDILAANLASSFDVHVAIAGFELRTASATRISASTASCPNSVRSAPLTPQYVGRVSNGGAKEEPEERNELKKRP